MNATHKVRGHRVIDGNVLTTQVSHVAEEACLAQIVLTIADPCAVRRTRIERSGVIGGPIIHLMIESRIHVTGTAGRDSYRTKSPEVVLTHTLERSEEHTSELQSRQYLVCRL